MMKRTFPIGLSPALTSFAFSPWCWFVGVVLMASLGVYAQRDEDIAPSPVERQVPKRMHAAMQDLPRIKVGVVDADIMGNDNRALQAAVDYVAALGGGTVQIGAGEFRMHDSLHLRSFVTLRGTPGKTVLRKAAGAASPLTLDGDYGEEQITVADPTGFEVGYGVAIWDSNANGFHTTVARITGRTQNTFSISRPLNADCMVHNGARAATVYPVVSGYDIEGARIENLIIDGNKEQNEHLNGCRGAGIFLYRAFGTVIDQCTVRNYNGDGISFQQSNDVTVTDCVSENNASLGIHPGSGSQRPTVRGCAARDNGQDGLFLCWRVRHGLFEDNVLEANGRHGISIGHKDTDNVLRHNLVRGNHQEGVCFRDESLGMAGHRNLLERNRIENNGASGEVAAIRIRGETHDVVLRDNQIRDTRPTGSRRQSVGIQLDSKVGRVTLENNAIDAKVQIKDLRESASGP